MFKWKLEDHRLIVDELNPTTPVAVLIDKSIGKWLIDLMNEAREEDKTLALAKEEIRELKLEITRLKLQIERRDSRLKEVGVETLKGRRKGFKVAKSKRVSGEHPTYAEKTCPGAGPNGPHLFSPTSGRQTMCPECRTILKGLKKKVGDVAKGATIRTEFRSGNSKPVMSSSERLIADLPPQTPEKTVEEPKSTRPSVEEVLRMPDGPEKKKLESQFTLAEKMEAAKVRFKIQREQMRAMRNRGFDPDDPIMGHK